MNKLKAMLCAVFTLMLVGSAHADSDHFAGPYIGVSISAYGVAAHGNAITGSTVENATNGVNILDSATVGRVGGVAGAEIGYAIPMGERFLIDIGASYLGGEAKIQAEGTDAGSEYVQFTVGDIITYYISPQVTLTDTAAVYVKVGISEADTGVVGDVTTPGTLSGTTWGLGLRTVLGNGVFLRTEAGFTEYNGLGVHGKGNTIAANNTYSAKPNAAYSMFSMGMRF